MSNKQKTENRLPDSLQNLSHDSAKCSQEIVSWNRDCEAYRSIKAAADAAGVSFDAFVKLVAYQAARSTTPQKPTTPSDFSLADQWNVPMKGYGTRPPNDRIDSLKRASTIYFNDEQFLGDRVNDSPDE